jgi:hypothetical protein
MRWAAPLLLLLLLLFGLLRSSSPRVLDIGSGSDALFLHGFFAPEQADATTFRWSSPAARVTLHGMPATPLLLKLRIHTSAQHFERMGSMGSRHLELQAAGTHSSAFELAGGWRTYQVLLPASTALVPPSPSFQLGTPRYCPGPDDRRVLGVALDRVQVTPLPAASRFVLSRELWALQRALLLTGLLALIGWLPGRFSVMRATAHQEPGDRGARNIVPPVLPALLLLFGNLALLLPATAVAWRGAAALLLLLLPGMLLARLLFADAAGAWLPMLFVALCGGVVLEVVGLLALQAVPGTVPWWVVLLLCDAASVALIAQIVKHPTPSFSPPTSHRSFPTTRRSSLFMLPFALFLFTGAALRLPFLGGAEFQGDEARAMLMAAGVLHGQDEILLLHRKGPVEVLLPAGVMMLTRQVNEWTARLPFALAGIGVLVGAFLLAQRMARHSENERHGSSFPFLFSLFPLSILALDGFLIAFSRIVQYQSVVVCMSIAALWCCWRFYEGAPHPRRSLLAAALLLAVGLLAHYDAILTLPALVWLVLAGGWRRGWRAAQWLRTLALPIAAGALLVGSFYLPFVLHDHFAGTFSYMLERAGQQERSLPFVNNLPDYWQRATFYNTTFQMHSLAVLLLAAVLTWLLRYVRPRLLGGALAVLLLAGVAVLLLAPERMALPEGGSLAIVPFGLPLIALALAPHTPPVERTLVLWFAVPFIAESFLIGDPRTHFYTMHPPAALLIGCFIAQVVQWLQQRGWVWLTLPLALGGAAVVLLALPYLYLLFLQQHPEYQRTFPSARPDIYRASYGASVPEGGHFGFPHHDGWKVVGELYRQGVLEGTYFSNQRERVSGWYTRGAFRCEHTPDYYMLATLAGNAAGTHIPVGQIRQEYDRLGCVVEHGINKMNIYSKAAVTHPPLVLQPEEYRARFDAQQLPNFPIQRSLVETVPQYRLDERWQRGVLLHGYDLDRQHLAAGETATLLLSWQRSTPAGAGEIAALPSLEGYEVVVRVRDSTTTHTMPVNPLCQPLPPTEWSHFYASDTAFSITADTSMAEGVYTIEVGLRHRQSGAWLPLADGRKTRSIGVLHYGKER